MTGGSSSFQWAYAGLDWSSRTGTDVTVYLSVPNTAPEFSDTSLARSVAENTATDTDIGAVIPAATDADSDDLEYTMEGTDAASFTFDASSRQIKTSAALDFEAKSSYEVTIKADDGTDSDTATVTISVTDVDEPPSRPGASSWVSC